MQPSTISGNNAGLNERNQADSASEAGIVEMESFDDNETTGLR